MIIKINQGIDFKLSVPFDIEYTENCRCAIRDNWDKFIEGKDPKDYFNGDVFYVTNMSCVNGRYSLEIGKGKFAELVYSKQTGKLRISSLFVASYIVTADNYYCIIMNKRNRINTIGGMADKRDFSRGCFIPENCLAREIKEEMGLNLHDKTIFPSFDAKFLKAPVGSETTIPMYPIGILYEINTALTRKELIQKFQDNIQYTDGEIQMLLFYNNCDYHQLEKCENKESYIVELFNCVARG